MRTDPRDACKNERQRLLWAIVHDGLAHPLMVLTGYCKAALRFHDWTSYKAWPRKENMHISPQSWTGDRVLVEKWAAKLRLCGIPFVLSCAPDNSGRLMWSVAILFFTDMPSRISVKEGMKRYLEQPHV